MMQTFIQKEVCTVFGTQWIKYQEYFTTIAKIVSSCSPSLSWQPLHVPVLVASLCPGHAVQCTHSPALICFRQRWRLWNTPWTLKKRLFLWSEKSECLQVVHAMQCQWTSSAVGLGEFCSLLWVFVLGCCHSPLAADLAWRHPSPCQRQALACSFLWIRRERHIQGREEQLYVSQCHNHRCVFPVCDPRRAPTPPVCYGDQDGVTQHRVHRAHEAKQAQSTGVSPADCTSPRALGRRTLCTHQGQGCRVHLLSLRTAQAGQAAGWGGLTPSLLWGRMLHA